ncbi:MAG: hydroxyacylglutathione hydrolase [Alphaproteobacteria bacterium]|nr:hydroxyacylglutathione hydrolase [Alphaproteobacteria bacterium]
MITYSSSDMDVTFVPVHQDNYAFILRTKCGVVGVVDPGEATPVIRALKKMELEPDYIFVTHHHWDHADGVAELKTHYLSCKVVAPDAEKHKIAAVDIPLKDGGVLEFGSQHVRTIATPGHTLGSLCYYFEEGNTVFTGDTLFSLSCGHLFEGTVEQMFSSFEKLKALPDETLVYCGHEYTRSCAGFCLRVDPENEDLKERIAQVKDLRDKGFPSLPSTIGMEKKTNVFFMAKNVGEFAALLRKKNS